MVTQMIMHQVMPFCQQVWRETAKKLDAFHRIRTDTVCGLNAFSLPIGVRRQLSRKYSEVGGHLSSLALVFRGWGIMEKEYGSSLVNSAQYSRSINLQGAIFPLMADKARNTTIVNGLDTDTNATDLDDGMDSSLEAANAIPVVMDDMDDETSGRQPIDLDAPVKDTKPKAATADAETSELSTASAKEVEDLKAQLAQAKDNLLRTQADMQNYRRRTEETQKRITADANERLIKELLPVLDDFELALDAARKSESYEQLIGGVSAVSRKFLEALSKQGIAPIPAVGEKFDTDVHEAVMLDEDSDEPDETVSGELRRGYTLNGRVIRAALVKVAKKS